MITIANVSVQYGNRILFDNIAITIGSRDKIGLVGRNGAGKSTLLKIIAKQQPPDEGSITYPTEATIGFLHQDLMLPKGKTVLDETLTAFKDTKVLEQKIEAFNLELGQRTDYESEEYHALINNLADATERFQLLGGGKMQAEAERVLSGLGFKSSDMNRLTDEFSGGWKMRIELAKILLQRPSYLLLDEPTNHLDIESIIWLEGFLKNYEGAVLIISHDKTFLDNITTRTIEIELGNLYDYKASFSRYRTLRAERKALQEAAYKNQQRLIAEKEKVINKFIAKASKTKTAQSMQKQLDRMERIEIDQEDVAAMRIQFPPAPRSGQVALEIEGLVKRYDELVVLNGVEFKMDRGDRVAFVGQNGQGKTTLSKIIAQREPFNEGNCQLGYNVEIGYYAQNQAESLHPSSTILQTMENIAPPELRTKVRSILGAFMFSGEDVDKKVSVLSGGERARLALACLLLRPFNLLILDEPTNHLDMISKDVLKQALQEYEGSLIVVSHDRDFLQGLTTRTLEFRDHQLHDHIGDVYDFLNKRKMEDMRQVEMATVAAASTRSETKPLSYDERKQLQRLKKKLEKAVEDAETQIEKTENAIRQIELEMADPAFYGSPKELETVQRYQNAKKKLEKLTESWENAHLELEAFLETNEV